MKTYTQFIIEARTAESDAAFFARIERQAAAAGDRFPKLTAAQAAIESGFGTAQSGKNNVFGQKGKGTTRRTREVVNGRDVNIDAEFQDFDSEEDSTKNRVNKWSYKYGDAKDLESAARNLQLPLGAKIPGSNRTSHGVYATDPNYVSTITRIAREHGGSGAGPSSVAKPSSKTFTKKVIDDKGGKGGKVTTHTAYKTKLGGKEATSTRGDSGNQVIRADLGKVKTPVKDQKISGTLGGQKGSIEIKGGNKTFTAIKPSTNK